RGGEDDGAAFLTFRPALARRAWHALTIKMKQHRLARIWLLRGHGCEAEFRFTLQDGHSQSCSYPLAIGAEKRGPLPCPESSPKAQIRAPVPVRQSLYGAHFRRTARSPNHTPVWSPVKAFMRADPISSQWPGQDHFPRWRLCIIGYRIARPQSGRRN